MIKNK